MWNAKPSGAYALESAAGKENILNAYKVAVQNKYRFFSFGDAMYIGDINE